MVDMQQLERKQSPSARHDPRADETALRDAIQSKLKYELGKSFKSATDHDWFYATALAVRDRTSRYLDNLAPRDQTVEEKAGLLSFH